MCPLQLALIASCVAHIHSGKVVGQRQRVVRCCTPKHAVAVELGRNRTRVAAEGDGCACKNIRRSFALMHFGRSTTHLSLWPPFGDRSEEYSMELYCSIGPSWSRTSSMRSSCCIDRQTRRRTQYHWWPRGCRPQPTQCPMALAPGRTSYRGLGHICSRRRMGGSVRFLRRLTRIHSCGCIHRNCRYCRQKRTPCCRSSPKPCRRCSRVSA